LGVTAMAAILLIASAALTGAPVTSLNALPTSVETGGDPDDVIADRFRSIIDVTAQLASLRR
jgi:hypothetical protein